MFRIVSLFLLLCEKTSSIPLGGIQVNVTVLDRKTILVSWELEELQENLRDPSTAQQKVSGANQSDASPVHQTILRPKANISSNTSSNFSLGASQNKTNSSEIDNTSVNTTDEESDVNSNVKSSNQGSRKHFIKSLESKKESHRLSVGTQFNVASTENTKTKTRKGLLNPLGMGLNDFSDPTDGLYDPSDLTDGLNDPSDNSKGLNNTTEEMNNPAETTLGLDDPADSSTVLNDISEPLDTEESEESQNQLEILYTKNNERSYMVLPVSVRNKTWIKIETLTPYSDYQLIVRKKSRCGTVQQSPIVLFNTTTLSNTRKPGGSEMVLVVIIMILWGVTLTLFFQRWGKIRSLLPYQPVYSKEMTEKIAIEEEKHLRSRHSDSICGEYFQRAENLLQFSPYPCRPKFKTNSTYFLKQPNSLDYEPNELRKTRSAENVLFRKPKIIIDEPFFVDENNSSSYREGRLGHQVPQQTGLPLLAAASQGMYCKKKSLDIPKRDGDTRTSFGKSGRSKSDCCVDIWLDDFPNSRRLSPDFPFRRPLSAEPLPRLSLLDLDLVRRTNSEID